MTGGSGRPVRQAVRVVLLDPDDRVLLLWHARPGDDDHWAPPGGGVEPGEDLRTAAARELAEEVGLAGVALARPVWLWQHCFRYHGRLIEQHETVYAARVPSPQVPGGAARHLVADGIAEMRWWSLPELARCRKAVWPGGLAHLAPMLLHGDLDPELPRDLGRRA